MKEIHFTKHSLSRINLRGTSKGEIIKAIKEGEKAPAKAGRKSFRKNFSFKNKWKGKYYEVKQVMPIIKEEKSKIIIITVYTFYFGGHHENKI